VTTASAAIACSLGYGDGQPITLNAMVEVVGRAARAAQTTAEAPPSTLIATPVM
jgi:2-methylisocitrate lyase-like PEP mutase family enzyme